MGAVIDGCPSGLDINEEYVQGFLNRRRPGQSAFTTQRSEADAVNIMSGVYEGKKHILDDQLNVYVKRLRKKIGNTGFLYVVIDACHAGTASRANDETIRGTHVGFTSNHKVFKPSTTKKSHYKH